MSSSDVERARALSKRLDRADQESRGLSARAPEPAYIRFTATHFGEKSTPLVSPTPPLLALSGAVDWAQLIDWIRELVFADAVFLSDASGLLVALAGSASHEHAEAMGARLVLAFEHADRMEAGQQTSHFISLDFGAVVVSGLRVDVSGSSGLVLGIAASSALSAELRTQIARALSEGPS